jgi:hypothetical protein
VETLDLSFTAVTDAGVAHLKARSLNLRCTRVMPKVRQWALCR